MNESIIFNSPLLLVLYGIALSFFLFGLNSRSGKIIYLSTAIVVGTSAYALVIGATLFETAVVVVIFLIINLTHVGKEKDGKDK